ncbi:hypothetical protein [Paenibacillus sp. GCM10027626]|uniref:hypothetical protein n=1 Tax=Paenibacillus sp. GCM10027626 TaxID=3273411 RepID=UPI003624F98A
MTKNIIGNLQMESKYGSYVDAMHAILTHMGWFRLDKSLLAGMTVSGFRFNVNRKLAAESTSAYNWMAENFLAGDFIGVTASQKAGFSFQPTFPLYQQRAIIDIKTAVDRGAGAIFWHDGFAVVTGYDDRQGQLYYCDGAGSPAKTLPYEHFGCNSTPYWYYQLLEACIPLDLTAIYKESFLQAIYKWETHDLVLPEHSYACGQAAYDAIIEALVSGNYDREGAQATFLYYAEAKRHLAAYTDTVQKSWPHAGAAAANYSKLAQLFEEIAAAEENDVVRLALFKEARNSEECAIEELRQLVREAADNRFHDIGLR